MPHDQANLATEPDPELDAEALARLEASPSGALALAGVAVGLLLAAWLLMYFFTFLPRGPVG